MNSNAIFWLVLAVVLGIIETSTANLITVWFALSALVAAVLAAFGAEGAVLPVVFVVLSAALVLATRPVTKRFLAKKTVATNADRIISAKGTVVERIDALENSGQVKVMGQIWSAKTANGETLQPGTVVFVKALEGVRVVVEKAEDIAI
ncbi:MAG: NfeD family protein [Clostridia bacterium]|nr:NfeD family protein [Clostridia bacterium]